MLKARYINTFKEHDKFPVPNVVSVQRVSSMLCSYALFDVKVRAKANVVVVVVRMVADTAVSRIVRAAEVKAAPAITTVARAVAL